MAQIEGTTLNKWSGCGSIELVLYGHQEPVSSEHKSGICNFRRYLEKLLALTQYYDFYLSLRSTTMFRKQIYWDTATRVSRNIAGYPENDRFGKYLLTMQYAYQFSWFFLAKTMVPSMRPIIIEIWSSENSGTWPVTPKMADLDNTC